MNLWDIVCLDKHPDLRRSGEIAPADLERQISAKGSDVARIAQQLGTSTAGIEIAHLGSFWRAAPTFAWTRVRADIEVPR